MKRLTAIVSSDSDSDDLDIKKIKNHYKNSTKVPKNDETVKTTKGTKNDHNQMSIMTAFHNASATKRKSVATLDNFVQKVTKVVKPDLISITPQDFFSKKTPLNENRENVETKIEKSLKVNKEVTKTISPIKSVLKDTNIKGVKSPKNKATIPVPCKIENSPIIKTKALERDASPVVPAISNIITEAAPSPNRASFAKFMHRGGPQALGSKEIPEGSPNCLMSLTFVITGVLDSIERDDAQSLIERHGGRVTKAVSGRTSYLIVGQEPGQSKIDKAGKMKVKQINEDELFELIRSSSAKLGYKPKTEAIAPQNSESITDTNKMEVDTTEKKLSPPMPLATNIPIKVEGILTANPIVVKPLGPSTREQCSTLFVDKYRPTTFKEIIGQHGDRSPANKLLIWLKKFEDNLNNGTKVPDDDGGQFRAVLLSGPPGIGKTTTAQIVAKQLGYHTVELNASNVRSKNNIKNVIAESLQTMSFYQATDMKRCVIMDEVDGMAGNEDRGGINELMQVIKTTRHPIICICNDRQSRKLQSFVKHVYDIRFRQLTTDQIKATIRKVAFREKIKLPEGDIDFMVKASNFDMRQVLNNLQFWSASNLDLDTLRSDAQGAVKEFKVGPFDVIGKVFSHEGCKTLSDKTDLFFQDYQLGGLFVQENYPQVRPLFAKGDMGKTMKLMSLAADSICMGDICARKISATNNWTVLPYQAMFASVIPGQYLHGRLSARIEFPAWLGKNSKTNKNARILSSVVSHLSLSSKGGVSHGTTVAMDYGELLVKRLVGPLREGDIETTLKNLSEMQLTKDDMDLMIEATCWSHLGPPLAGVQTQTKSALTRAYNKACFKLPYATMSLKKSVKTSGLSLGLGEEEMDGGVELEEEDDDDGVVVKEDDIASDAMIVKRKVAAATTTTSGTKDAKVKRAPTKREAKPPKDPKDKKPAAKRAKK